MTLSIDLCRSFESDLWALFPLDVDLLMHLLNTDFTVENPIETAYKGMDLFEYVLVPLPGMDCPITRLAPPQEHLYPYTTMPILRLRVQPHYVVFNTVAKLRKYEETREPLSSHECYEPFYDEYRLADMYTRGLFKMWMTRKVPPKFLRDSGADLDLSGAGVVELGAKRSAQAKRPGAFVFLPEDPADIWDDDEVGLGPADSITHIPENEYGEDTDDDDDDDEFSIDETDSVFESRMRYWVANLLPGLTPPGPQLVPNDAAHKEELDSILLDGGLDTDQGSPTMVGSFVADDSKMDLVEKAPGGRRLKRMHGESVRTKAISDMSLDSSAFALA
ncbi:hypothetical protein DXG01_014981 [Tephrocybe rancida]|nr:hypothetical protein DXG01_014981 [Tephrocybe rancida]